MKHLYIFIILTISTSCFAQDDFITTWRTTSPNESITISTSPGETYNYFIYWDDGSPQSFHTGDVTHTYATPGDHVITINGSFPRMTFFTMIDHDKIISVDQWGDQQWTSMYNAFLKCSNLEILATDVPDLSNVGFMTNVFRDCTTFNQDISNWDVSNVFSMQSSFSNCTSFDQDLSAWNVESVTAMDNMFKNVTLSIVNYDALLIGWNDLTLQPNNNFHGGNSTYCDGIFARTNMIENNEWTIIDGGLDPGCLTTSTSDFITTWETTSANESITIPTTGGGYDYTIYWGDGTAHQHQTGDATHTYTDAGQYQVSISGDFPRIYINNSSDKDKIISIDQWGDQQWTSMSRAFLGCSNLVGLTSDVPDLSNLTSLSLMFANATSFNQDISDWDVSNVTDMTSMFVSADAFNQDIDDWDVTNVTSMHQMFFGVTAFDQDLSGWDVSNVTDMVNMFLATSLSSANYDAILIGWDALDLQPNVSFGGKVYCNGIFARTNMIENDGWLITDSGLDPGCLTTSTYDFITTWETTSANESITIPTTGSGYDYTIYWGDGTAHQHQTGNSTHTYTDAGQYEVSISGNFPRIYFNNSGDKDKIISIDQWGSQHFTSMRSAFMGCSNLNITATDFFGIEAIIDFRAMFFNCTSLDADINYWNVSGISNMRDMFFGCTSFNSNLDDWQVEIVSDMRAMFHGCTSFNRNISSWNVSSLENSIDMFRGATSFDQDLSIWNVESVTEMDNMFRNITLSTTNYDALLIGWNDLTLQPNVNFHGGNSIYCAGSCARQNMIDNDGWTINDGDEASGCIALTANASATDETANDANDGTATCAPVGGTSPYSYLWSNGAMTQMITGLAPGNYTVTVSDDASCTSDMTVTVAEFICPSLTIMDTETDVNCFEACDGMISIDDVTNGISPFTYVWSNGATSQTIDNLCPDTYMVTVTDSKNCTVSASYTITEPTVLIVNASATDETANNANDGTATCAPSGGVTSYNYQWNTGASTQTITNLTSGTYTVTITDGNDCTAEETVTVAAFVCPTLTILDTREDVICFGSCDGFISIDGVTNGVSPYTYAWSNGASTATISNLCPATYMVTVTDTDNCSVSSSYTIIEPTELFINASATDETANDANDGTATCAPAGGVTPYSYLWSTGESTQSIANLAPGTYTVSVTDGNDCLVEETVSVAEFGCSSLTISSNQADASCAEDCDGSITIDDITNGEAPYTYTWSTGASTATIDDLCAGDYSVTIVDGNNCTVFGSYTLLAPNVLMANALATDETSNNADDGTATANPTGGTAPYSYLWSNSESTSSITGLAPGNYTVTITDDHDCDTEATVMVAAYECNTLTLNFSQSDISCHGTCDGTLSINTVNGGTAPYTYLWSNGATTVTVEDLCSGDYSVLVTDANNCTVTSPTISITEPAELTASATATDETANNTNDGTASASQTGGTAPYTYLWSNGQTTATITGLAPNSYTVTITDAHNCSAVASVSVAEFGCQTLTIEITENDASCHGDCDGSLSIASITNGEGPYTYTWSTGASSAAISDLCADSYEVTIVDANGCNIFGTYEITEPPVLAANATSTNETTNNANNGTANANPSGGTPPYSYLWSTGVTTASIAGLAPGTYTITVTDAQSCSAVEMVEVITLECPTLTIMDQAVDVTCYGVCDGTLAILGVQNGIAPFTYLWDTGATGALINNLCAGDYTVTITDDVGCSVIGTLPIVQPDEIVITIDTKMDITSATNGAISISVSGGSYTYSWSGPESFTSTSEDIDDLGIEGCYTLSVSESITGCSKDTTICIDNRTAVVDLDQLSKSIIIYPNPSQGEFTIDFTEMDTKASATIYTLTGNIESTFSKRATQSTLSIDINHLVTGLYLLRIDLADGRYTYKKVIVRRF